MQMNDNSIWDVETFSVKGTGESRATYSGGNQKLYVMIPNKSSVDEVKGNISQIIDLDIE
jgi:hypothetical protein